uniref:Integrator complex subunit 7 n=1 Tax=Aceria tosichella TaxID=561515 RepID=A0A6G1S9S8_9ACAR
MDPEARDANSLLVELDRGLQSPNINDQCDTVVRFTTLFQKYPLPLLVNSAFLKLAEAFRVGSNMIRIKICEVFELNQKHLNKIHNVDDLYRSLFAVTTSNDPIARSIALLALGHIATIVSDYKGVHHCISSSLDGSVEFELTATIICTASYVKHSAEFACNIYPRIVSIIDSNKYPVSTKIRALAALDHKFYNANDAMTVRSFLIDVIQRTSLKKLMCACLTLSTKISYNSLSHIIAQIELLLKIFQDEPQQVVKACVLKNLLFLAEKSPHIWESSHVEPLVSYLEQTVVYTKSINQNHFVGSVLSIFCKLLTCKCNFIMQQEKDRIFALCYKFALTDSDLSLCSMAFELLTVKSEEYYHQSAKNMVECPTSDETTETLNAIKTFLIQSAPQKPSPTRSKTSERPATKHVSTDNSRLKSIYRHIVNLCSLNPHYCSEILKLVFDRISSKDIHLAGLSDYYTEMMCAMSKFSTDYIVTTESCWKLINTKHHDLSETNLLNLCVLYFQTMRLQENESKYVQQPFIHWFQHRGRSLWLAYKVMRQAMRYGHFEIASQLCEYLHKHVTRDNMDYYFKSLHRICRAESILSANPDLDENLENALPYYEESMSPLRASVGLSKTTSFQLQFVWLRIRTLQIHSDLRRCCRIFEYHLPITNEILLGVIGATRGAKIENGHHIMTIQQMIKISKDFRALANCYENLSLTVSQDCDHRTSSYIYLLKSSCIIMADVIDAVFQYGKNHHVINKLTLATDKESALEHRGLEMTCNKLIDSIKNEIIKPGIFPSQKTIQPYIVLFRSFSNQLLSCPLSFPRRFFQITNQQQISPT